MTAMNAFAREEGAYIVADTGHFLADGVMTSFSSKVAFSNRLRLMIGHSGAPGPNCQESLQAHLDLAVSQASALAAIPALLCDLKADAEDLHAAHRNANQRARARGVPETAFPAQLPAGLRLTVAWWCDEERRARCAGIADRDDFLAVGIPALEWRHFGTLFTPEFKPGLWQKHTFRPLEDVDRLAEVQRRTPMSNGVHMVAGAFELFRASAEGIEGFTVVEWPDAIGEKAAVPCR